MEVVGNWNPVSLAKEKRISEDDASNLVVLMAIGGDVPVLRDSPPHLINRSCSILLLKGFPGKAGLEEPCTNEKASPDDEILRVVELEQERLPYLKSLKHSVPARLPEIDLVERRQIPEESKPLVVSDSDISFHWVPQIIRSAGEPVAIKYRIAEKEASFEEWANGYKSCRKGGRPGGAPVPICWQLKVWHKHFNNASPY
jgi:hypothetical protein